MSVRAARVGLILILGLAVGAAFAAAGADPGAAESDGGPWVLRVYTNDRARLGELARRFDLWSVDRRGGYALVLVDRAGREALEAEGDPVEVDDARTAELHAPHERLPGQTSGIPGYPCYRTVPETYADLAALASDHPTLATWHDFGDSWEKLHGPGAGFELMELVLTNSEVPGPKAPFVVIAAMHAREYATAELVTRFAEQLVGGHGVDGDATWILDHTEIHVVPQLNPDGRIRAETGAYWRKNVDNGFCADSDDRGIDLNRNGSFLWGLDSGSSGSACSETFRGPSEASEPETFAVEALLASVFPDQRAAGLSAPAPATATGVFVSVHSAGGYVLYPWEAISSAAPNETAIVTLGRKLGFYTGYDVCQDCLPVASGTTVDEAYGEYGVAAYTFEIGTAFFQSCSSFASTILPANLAALRYAAKAARRPYQDPAGPEVVGLAAKALDDVTLRLDGLADDGRFAGNDPGEDEPVQNVLSASYTIDGPPWEARGLEVPMAALDGSFDETAEAITGVVDLSTLAAGRHVVFVAATDANGRRGVPSALLVDSLGPVVFRDGFEGGGFDAWTETVPGTDARSR